MIKHNIPVPQASQYKEALSKIELNEGQHAMLKAHYLAHNRSITFTDLAVSAGYSEYSSANLHYGNLGKKIGDAVGFQYWEDDKGKKFFSSSIGQGDTYADKEFQIIMHHELAKALTELAWF